MRAGHGSRWAMLGVVVACDGTDDRFQYGWDDRRILCSRNGDDLTGDLPMSTLAAQMQVARDLQSATIIHVHGPGVNVSVDRLGAILDQAESHGLELVTFADLVPGRARAALALAFDDDSIDEWYGIRDLLDTRRAKVTFFVTLYHTLDDARRQKLTDLASDGHAIEAHGVQHLEAPAFIAMHGVSAYLGYEVLPSVEILRADGHEPSSFAFPYGASTDEANAAVLEHLDRARVGPASCPH